MLNQFEIANGQIIGRRHRQTGQNNQDAMYWHSDERALIGIVCDGCGSHPHTEVGAQISARIVAAEIGRMLAVATNLDTDETWAAPEIWENIRLNTLAQINRFVQVLGNDRQQIIRDYFLFTVVGFLITPVQTVAFAGGDGLIIINNTEITLGPFPNNAPPYIAYELVDTVNQKDTAFKICESIPTADLDRILIGTDGVIDLQNAEYKNLPGKNTPVGPLRQFVDENLFFQNPDLLRRRLTLINRDTVRYIRNGQGHITDIKKEYGLLPDDTTVIAVRRKS
jgi:nitrate reductase NapE component